MYRQNSGPRPGPCHMVDGYLYWCLSMAIVVLEFTLGLMPAAQTDVSFLDETQLKER